MSKRILVVEDQEDNRKILRDLLTSVSTCLRPRRRGDRMRRREFIAATAALLLSPRRLRAQGTRRRPVPVTGCPLPTGTVLKAC